MDWERQESRERSLVELVADARRELELARAVRGRSQRGSRRVRESFRRRCMTMPALDMVVQAKSPAAAASNEEIRVSLERHWQELEKRCAVS